MPNDLIAVFPHDPRTIIRLYIQFIHDVDGTRSLDGKTYYGRIVQQLPMVNDCLGYTINIHPVPSNTFKSDNFLEQRDPDAPNPFQPPDGVPLPDTPAWEKDEFGQPVEPQTVLPLIRFYIGDGESLTQRDSDGKLRIAPGFGFECLTRTSFFNRHLRAGYLFVGGPVPPEHAFVHELGHVLGLSERYIEGIDDAAPGHPTRCVGEAVRRTVPLSKGHINDFLSAADEDAAYDPQNNLMSSLSYNLSTYQRNVIEQKMLEEEYGKDDVVVLLFRHPECKKPSLSEKLPCRREETGLWPSFVVRDALNGKDTVKFESDANPIAAHNAYFHLGSDKLVRFVGNKQLHVCLLHKDGLEGEVFVMIRAYFGIL